MGKLIDLTGQKFNKLLVLERDFNYPDKRRAYWKCQCDCGNIITTRGESLRSGHTKSCGKCNCEKTKINNPINKKQKKRTKNDYTGQHIGRLTVLGKYTHPIDKHHTFWECICDCGNKCIKRSDTFRSVPVPSCGCYKKEHTSQQWAAQLEGQRFGKLVVMQKVPHEELRTLWKCQCDCGNICYLPSRYLLSLNVKSCGCETKSKGELELRQILQIKKINFKEQYTFKDCISEKNSLYKFDIAIFDKNNILKGLIEFNGQQHYEIVEYFGGEKQFLIQQKRDEDKRKYCKLHNYSLLEIPYTELGHINIDNFLKQIGVQ